MHWLLLQRHFIKSTLSPQNTMYFAKLCWEFSSHDNISMALKLLGFYSHPNSTYIRASILTVDHAKQLSVSGSTHCRLYHRCDATPWILTRFAIKKIVSYSQVLLTSAHDKFTLNKDLTIPNNTHKKARSSSFSPPVTHFRKRCN